MSRRCPATRPHRRHHVEGVGYPASRACAGEGVVGAWAEESEGGLRMPGPWRVLRVEATAFWLAEPGAVGVQLIEPARSQQPTDLGH